MPAPHDPARVNSRHVYAFCFYGTPTVEQLEEELRKGKEAVGGNAKVHIRSTEEQRDGYSMDVTLTQR